jgi:hypothetical protein
MIDVLERKRFTVLPPSTSLFVASSCACSLVADQASCGRAARSAAQ